MGVEDHTKDYTRIPATRILEPDCRFIVEGVTLNANKSFLAERSPVFDRMFRGVFPTDTVLITDITLETFRQMIAFVHAERQEFGSVVNTWSLYYAADKYMLKDLAEHCIAHIQKNLTMSTLALSYEYAEMYGLKDVQEGILRDLCDLYRGIFHDSPDYYHMKPSTLYKILDQPSVNATDTQICEGVIKWAWYEVEDSEFETSAAGVVDLLGHTPLLDLMVNFELDSRDLARDDKIFPTLVMMENYEHLGNRYQRSNVKKHWCTFCRSRTVFKIASRIEMRRGDVLTSSVYVNKRMLLYGVVVMSLDDKVGFGCDEYRGTIFVQVRNLKNPLIELNTVYSKSMPFSTLIYVPLSQLVAMEIDTLYEIRVGYAINRSDYQDLPSESVLTYYMNPNFTDKKRGISFNFNEINGSVIHAMFYYPL